MIDRILKRRVEPGTTLWFFGRDRIAVISFSFILIVVLGSLCAPWLTPFPEDGKGFPNVANMFLPPSKEHPLGTDDMGRDLFARVLFGARISLTIGFVVVPLGMVLGSTLGALAGYFGGWVDELIMRVTDVFLAFPPLLLAITISAALQPSLWSSILAISVVWWPWYTRIVRAQTLSVRERDFVRAAQAIGVKDLTIIRWHILPNVLTPVLVQGALDLGAAILTGAALSFLGLGTQPPAADWALMIGDGRVYILSGKWWISTFPGLALFFTVLALNMIGDGIQTALDPRIRVNT